MPAAEVARPAVVISNHVHAYTTAQFRNKVTLGLGAAGVTFLLGTVLDFGILWWFEHVPGPQWEFTALSSTAAGLPRIVLALALLYGALYVRGSTSLRSFRVLAVASILSGLAGGLVGALTIVDYLVLRPDITPEAQQVFRSTMLETLALSIMYMLVMVPVGVLGFRRPRGS